MGKVRQILGSRKGYISVEPESSVYNALLLMIEKNISGVLVTENGRLLGIFTERDYATKVAVKGRASKETIIKDVMTSTLFTVTLDTTIAQCMSLMSEKKIRHLPVLDGAELVGVISIGDLVRYIIEEQRGIIEELEHYITGH